MGQNLTMFRFYKGEPANPFDWDKQNAAHIFWDYEHAFNDVFTAGTFSIEVWKRATMTINTQNELKKLLAVNPVNKEELFKLWLYHILMEYLPDKHEGHEVGYFNDLYWAMTSTSR